MSPDWFKPGARVRLKDAWAWMLGEGDRTGTLLSDAGSRDAGALLYRGDLGGGARVRAEHVEPLDAPAAEPPPRKIAFREFL